jgi:4-hydroxyproline epimerase
VPLDHIDFIDSHTAGEPTRVVLAGGPQMHGATLADRVSELRDRHDDFRRGVVLEPRGGDVLVGALLAPPVDPRSAAGVIFFNNVGYLGMCGHGMIGVVATLAHLGRIAPGTHTIETPVGPVTAALAADGEITIANVASYRTAHRVAIEVPSLGEIAGDIAWGGNWFYLIDAAKYPRFPPLTLDKVAVLSYVCRAIREKLAVAGHEEVDHIELFNEPDDASAADSTNFVLCPGGAYDRSPCGTGTSAKLACLAADGHLAPGETWTQAGILGTTFQGQYTWLDRPAGRIAPTITGRAYVTAQGTLLFDPHDPFRSGIAP